MRWLVSACSGLGDTILKIPMLRALHEYDPAAVVDVLAYADRGIDQLLAGSPWVDEVLPMPAAASYWDRAKFFCRLRKRGYQAIFLSYEAAHPDLILGSYLAGIKKRVLHHGRTQNSVKNRLRGYVTPLLLGTLISALKQGRHKIDLNLDLLEVYFGAPLERDYSTPIHQSSLEPSTLQRFGLVKKRYLLFQPGAAKGAATPKTWSPTNFIELIKRLRQCWPELAMVTVGDKGDAEASSALQKELPFLINTAGLTTPLELIELLQGSLVVLCHDSGVMHLANALDATLIALYGPTDDTCTRPLGNNSHLLFSNNECRRLMYNWARSEREIARAYPTYHCLSGITVEQVYDTFRQLAGGGHGGFAVDAVRKEATVS